jgi:hypothetical protein
MLAYFQFLEQGFDIIQRFAVVIGKKPPLELLLDLTERVLGFFFKVLMNLCPKGNLLRVRGTVR